MVGANNQFSFTKLLVDDLEKCAVFYKQVCGLVETARVESEINGRAISEILFAPTSEGGATFVLLKFVDSPRPHNDEVINGFLTDDVDAFCIRVEEAGGRVTQPPKAVPEHGVKVAFVEDVEGHLIEVVQLL
jgi:lactoylglutathione lyase